MPEIVIEYFNQRATLRDMKWHSDSERLLQVLAMNPYEPLEYVGYAPDDHWSYVLQLNQMSKHFKIITPFPAADTEPRSVN
jgi:hypothetical protein